MFFKIAERLGTGIQASAAKKKQNMSATIKYVLLVHRNLLKFN
jgi:hypothetical protein